MDKKQLLKYFKALSNETRLEIFLYLVNRVKNDGVYVSEIAEDLDINQPTVSNHLKVLSNKGLIEENRVSQRVYITPSRSVLKDLLSFGQFFLEKRTHIRSIKDELNKFGSLLLIQKLGNNERHEVELYFYLLDSEIHLLAQSPKRLEKPQWLKNLKEGIKSSVVIDNKEFEVQKLKELDNDTDYRNEFRAKYGVEQYKLWFQNNQRTAVKLVINR